VDSETLVGLLSENGGEIQVATAQGEPLTITLVDGVLLPPSFGAGE